MTNRFKNPNACKTKKFFFLSRWNVWQLVFFSRFVPAWCLVLLIVQHYLLNFCIPRPPFPPPTFLFLRDNPGSNYLQHVPLYIFHPSFLFWTNSFKQPEWVDANENHIKHSNLFWISKARNRKTFCTIRSSIKGTGWHGYQMFH